MKSKKGVALGKKSAKVRASNLYADVSRPIAVRLSPLTQAALNTYCAKNKVVRNAVFEGVVAAWLSQWTVTVK